MENEWFDIFDEKMIKIGTSVRDEYYKLLFDQIESLVK